MFHSEALHFLRNPPDLGYRRRELCSRSSTFKHRSKEQHACTCVQSFVAIVSTSESPRTRAFRLSSKRVASSNLDVCMTADERPAANSCTSKSEMQTIMGGVTPLVSVAQRGPTFKVNWATGGWEIQPAIARLYEERGTPKFAKICTQKNVNKTNNAKSNLEQPTTVNKQASKHTKQKHN